MMLVANGAGVLIVLGAATEFVARVPRSCRRCGAMVTWFRNSEGETRCIHCAEREEAGHAAPVTGTATVLPVL